MLVLFERYIASGSSIASTIWTTMNLGYIDFFSSQEFNIAFLSLSPSLALCVCVLFLFLFSSFADSCFIPFYFILFYFFCHCQPIPNSGVIFLLLSSLSLSSFFGSFSWLSFGICLFVCVFFSFGFFICTSNFHQINLWWAQKQRKWQRVYIYYTNRSMVALSLSIYLSFTLSLSQSVLSNSIIPSLAAHFFTMLSNFFSLSTFLRIRSA